MGEAERGSEAVQWESWVPAAAFALAFGLATATTPVRAEDKVQINVLSKEERLAQQRERMTEEAIQYATKNQEAVKAEGGGVAAVGGKRKTARPVAKNKSPDSAESAEPAKSAAAPAPAKKAPEPDSPKKNKVIKSPADEIDPDELPSEAPNPPMLFAVVFGPATLFLTFWFLGSLNII